MSRRNNGPPEDAQPEPRLRELLTMPSEPTSLPLADQLAFVVYPGKFNHRGRETDYIRNTLVNELPRTLRALALEAEADVERHG